MTRFALSGICALFLMASCASEPPKPVNKWTVLFGEQVFVCESVPLQPKDDVTIDCVPKYH